MEEPVSEIVGLLLAGGASQRFGDDKLQCKLADGRPMIVAAAANLMPACDRLIAVLSTEDGELASLLSATGCQIVHAAHASLGIGASLAAGVKASAKANGWLVALADMPYIESRSHRCVLAQLRTGASLAATQYQGRRGHPVGFSKKWYSQLVGLRGSQGGKTLLERHPDELILCPVDDQGVVWDIDHPEDLQRAFKRCHNN
jgi:molybdenum cofactor cytidylyltransferase